MRKEKPNYSLKLISCPDIHRDNHDMTLTTSVYCKLCKDKDEIWVLRLPEDGLNVLVVRS